MERFENAITGYREQIDKSDDPNLKQLGPFIVQLAENDPTLAEQLLRTGKSLLSCTNYVLTQAMEDSRKLIESRAMLNEVAMAAVTSEKVESWIRDYFKSDKTEVAFKPTFKVPPKAAASKPIKPAKKQAAKDDEYLVLLPGLSKPVEEDAKKVINLPIGEDNGAGDVPRVEAEQEYQQMQTPGPILEDDDYIELFPRYEPEPVADASPQNKAGKKKNVDSGQLSFFGT